MCEVVWRFYLLFYFLILLTKVGKRKYGATSAKKKKLWATNCCGLWDLGMQLDSLTSFVKIVLFCHISLFSSLSALSIFFAFLHISTFQLFPIFYTCGQICSQVSHSMFDLHLFFLLLNFIIFYTLITIFECQFIKKKKKKKLWTKKSLV
jgi:hypothetical protein